MEQIKSTSQNSEAAKQTTADAPSTLVVLKEEPPQNTKATETKQDETKSRTELQTSKISQVPPPMASERPHIFCRIWLWIKRDTTSTDWLIVLLTAVIAATSYLQWHEIRSGSTDTHTLAQAADTQAKKMADMSTAADKIRQAADNMVIQDQRIADNARTAMDGSNKQSKTALDATIAASTLDQRAWIGVGAFRVVQFDKDGFKVDIEIRNSGKTPALDVSETMNYGWNFSLESGPQENWFVNLPLAPAEAIPPGGSHILHMIIGSDGIGPAYESIKSKAYRAYVFGRIKYTDISRMVGGMTDFCLFMSDPDKLDLSFCRTHNDMK